MDGVDNIIECAIDYAEERQHEYVTVEHLMMCLLESPEIAEIVDNISGDREVAIGDLRNYLDDKQFNGLVGETPWDGKPKKTTSVERVMQRAFAQVIFSARDQINPVDIFVSILSEDKSHAQYYC